MTVCYCMKQPFFPQMTVGYSILKHLSSLLLRVEDDCLLPLAPPLLGDFSFNGYCQTTLFIGVSPPPPSTFWVGNMGLSPNNIDFLYFLPYSDSRGTNFMCHCNLHFCVYSQAFFFNFCFIGIAEGFILRVSFQCTLLC